jgi:tRNA(Ile)-lysidine synthase
MKLSDETIMYLRNKKNLLAFSGGMDSSALFYILVNHNIDFDLAIVNYNIRPQSIDEVNYAKQLAEQYEKAIFVADVKLTKFNEKSARDIRYQFFEQIIKNNKYRNLITAHQLNDKLEWCIMQFTKGAGFLELIGMNEFELRDNYRLIRPLIDVSKRQIMEYLTKNNITYFIDTSNFDETITRNYFRHQFANKLLEEFEDGILRSFHYLEEDKSLLLLQKPPEMETERELTIFKNLQNDRINIFYIDKVLKKHGYLLSAKQREEILKTKECVIGNKWVVAINSDYIFIAPYRNVVMTKEFKEACRIKKIPKLIRPYLFEIRDGFI